MAHFFLKKITLTIVGNITVRLVSILKRLDSVNLPPTVSFLWIVPSNHFSCFPFLADFNATVKCEIEIRYNC